MKLLNLSVTWVPLLALAAWMALSPMQALAQLDQGVVGGVVQDKSGAVIPGAQITLTAIETGTTLQVKSNASGIYTFPPTKIGVYNLTASCAGFETLTQENIRLDIQDRLNIVLVLHLGIVSQTIMVSSAPSLLQTQSGSVGQVISSHVINDTPLSERNWVYIAQTTPGVVEAFGASASGTGDFSANGQHANQNNFILDGVDNNVHSASVLSGNSFSIIPPPDAMAEFKIQTADYSAEFGHVTGGVINASIKSGTNNIHGDVWEYDRNTALDSKDWNATTIPPYHENLFGATLGFPILRDKLFYFGDAEWTLNDYSTATTTSTVPTPLMREGNFSELSSTSLTGDAQPVQLYEPNSGGATKLSCNGVNNSFCPGQIDPLAQKILNLYPLPNANNGDTYNNLVQNLGDYHNVWQWDQRLDWNVTYRDQAIARFSYRHIQNHYTPALGSILSTTGAGFDSYLSTEGMASETHEFSPTLSNEIRFGYNWMNSINAQLDSSVDESTALGLGGVPYSPENGGLPEVAIGGITTFGASGSDPDHEIENTTEYLDNVIKEVGKHSLKFGVDFENIRTYATLLSNPRGSYSYTGEFTSDLNAANTGYGVADFLADQMDSAGISSISRYDQTRWYRAAYAQDDWRITQRLTLNLGIRYEYAQPFREDRGQQANFIPTSVGVGTGTGNFEIPVQANLSLSPAFTTLLANSNIAVQRSGNPSLQTAQETNFGPRIGFAFQPAPSEVVRGGFGIYYGGLENLGLDENLGYNYPFLANANYASPSCALNNCPSTGITLENGLAAQLAQGIQNIVSLPTLVGQDTSVKTPYAMNYNLSVETSLSNNLAMTVGYVGVVSRHMAADVNPNAAMALQNSSNTILNAEPFPLVGTYNFTTYEGKSAYNSLQASLQKRYANGLNFQANYTWARTFEDYTDPEGVGPAPREYNLIPMLDEYTAANDDFPDDFNFNGTYQLPFGIGRSHLNHSGLKNLILGGWNLNLAFSAVSGRPFTVTPNNTGTSGGSRRAILVRNPYTPGGTPDPSNPGITCAAHTRTPLNWYNPCAFANPEAGSNIPTSGTGSLVTGVANAIAFLGGKGNQLHGPGYWRLNTSLSKDFPTWRRQYLQFRVNAFNVLNHPTFSNPSTDGINTNGGLITATKPFENRAPDARFFQLSGQYVF